MSHLPWTEADESEFLLYHHTKIILVGCQTHHHLREAVAASEGGR